MLHYCYHYWVRLISNKAANLNWSVCGYHEKVDWEITSFILGLSIKQSSCMLSDMHPDGETVVKLVGNREQVVRRFTEKEIIDD